jgi:hypothetical protein
MAELYTLWFTGLACEKCSTVERPLEPIAWSDRREFIAKALTKGWTIWVSRSRRTYCPVHKPGHGTKLRQVEA